MNGKLTDAGGQYLLGVLFGTTAKPMTFTLQLFTDAAALADTDINTTHTLVVGGGYADISLSNDATISLNGSSIPIATWAEQTFTFTGTLTGAADITGYQVLQGTTLLFEETLDTVFTPTLNGDTLKITPSYVLGNGTPT